MKIALIYPGFKEDASGLSEPLGLLYIASVLREGGHEVSFFDMTFNQDKTLLRTIAKQHELIGMSSTSMLFNRTSLILKEIKKINPKIPSFLGGSHSTTDPRSALNAGFDYAIIGEGETTVAALVNALAKKSKIDSINGLAFKKRNKIVVNPKKLFIENLDKIPFPARDLWDYSSYFKSGTSEMGIIATRGCPYNCLYCKPMVDKLFGNKLRKRSAKNVVQEIEQIVKCYNGLFEGKVKLWFKDDTLTLCGIEWFKEFNEELRKRNLNISWGCHTRVDNVNYPLLKLMKQSGLEHISFGVESGSQKILNYYRKGAKVEQAITAFDICRKLKISTFAYFIIGAPIETRNDLDLTYKLIKRIKPDGLEVFTLMAYPGNDLYELVRKEGLLKEGKVNYYAKKSVIKLKYLTERDLNHYRRKIYRWNNFHLFLRYFTSIAKFKKLIRYIINRPGFVINYLKRSL
jgi:radical SAM superfamily enzyme YgiQ (UPF0313 family)